MNSSGVGDETRDVPVVGAWWIVGDGGPWCVAEIGVWAVRVEDDAGLTHWVSADRLTRQVDATYLNTYVVQAEARGIACSWAPAARAWLDQQKGARDEREDKS